MAWSDVPIGWRFERLAFAMRAAEAARGRERQ
jgi:hypothetical protein